MSDDYCKVCNAYGNVHDLEKHGPVEVIRIIFTSEDVYDLADEHGIDRDKALAAALDWKNAIEDTMTGYCFEQLESVIVTGQP